MSNSVIAVSILLISLLLWVLFTRIYREQPDEGVTAIIVGFSALCVFGLKGVISRSRKKEGKG
jgi:hypothetical protein